MAQRKSLLVETRLLPINKIQANTGQIPGLPKNPRLIRDERFKSLKKSIQDFPEMLDLREVVVFPFGRSFVCVGGNMRFLACKDLKHDDIPAKILPSDFPVERLREFAIKDNVGFGQDDLEALIADWGEFPLSDWGAEVPDLSDVDLDDFFKEDTKKDEEPETFAIVLNFATEQECNLVKNSLAEHGETFEAAVWKLLGL